MKKVLVIMRGFPGYGGGTGFRLVRNLPKYGYQPIVITQTTGNRSDKRGVDDFGVGSIEIRRTISLKKSPFRILSKCFHARKAARYLDRLFFVPDINITWLPSAFLAGMSILKREEIDSILTVSPPESNHIIGLLLKKHTKAAWIACFKDMWTTRKVAYKPPTPLHDYFIKKIEKQVYQNADHILANTYGNKEIYIKHYRVPEHKISVIHGGYDPEERQVLLSNNQGSKNKEFSIGYMGEFDKPWYPWREFLLALKKLIATNEDIKIKLNICGEAAPDTRRFIDENGLGRYVSYHGSFPHPEAVRRISKSDLLLVLACEAEHSKSMVPHKLYNYLAMGKTIMAITEEKGEAGSIIKRTNTGGAVSVNRPDGIYNMLSKYYEEWQRYGFLKYEPNESEIKNYDLSFLAEKLSGILKSC